MWLRGASVCVKLIREYLILLSTVKVSRSFEYAVVLNVEILVHDEPSTETSTFPCTP